MPDEPKEILIPTPKFALPAIRPDDENAFPVSSTLPQLTPHDRMKVLSIIEGEAVDGSKYIGEEISFGDYVIHSVDMVDDETGEQFQALRTLLLQPEGPPIQFVSVGILSSIKRIVAAMRQLPPYDPPLLVKVVQVATRGGRRTFKLKPIVED